METHSAEQTLSLWSLAIGPLNPVQYSLALGIVFPAYLCTFMLFANAG